MARHPLRERRVGCPVLRGLPIKYLWRTQVRWPLPHQTKPKTYHGQWHKSEFWNPWQSDTLRPVAARYCRSVLLLPLRAMLIRVVERKEMTNRPMTTQSVFSNPSHAYKKPATAGPVIMPPCQNWGPAGRIGIMLLIHQKRLDRGPAGPIKPQTHTNTKYGSVNHVLHIRCPFSWCKPYMSSSEITIMPLIHTLAIFLLSNKSATWPPNNANTR